MRLKIVAVSLLVGVHLFLSGCSDSSKHSATDKSDAGKGSSYQVAIVQQGAHEILNEVSGGCEGRLREVLGKRVNVKILNGGGDEERLRQIAQQVVTGPYDVIVTVATPATLAVIGASDGKKPILFTFVTNPKAVGYTEVGSIRNVSGLSNETGYEGTLDAIQDFLPAAHSLGYLMSSEPNAKFIFSEFENRAAKRGMSIITSNIESAQDIPNAARRIAAKVDCFLLGGDHTLVQNIDPLLDVAQSFQRPVFSVDKGTVEKGAIAASTISYTKMGVATAEKVLELLNGADANAMPLTRYQEFELVVNEEAAAQLGMTIPEQLKNEAVLLKRKED